jgi:hypothetical protein
MSNSDLPPGLSSAPAASASELLAALRRLAAEGKVTMTIAPERLNHIDSPVAVEADGNIWAYAFLLAAALVGWRWGVIAGLMALALGVALYFTLGRAYVHRRIERRVRRDALQDLEKWRKLWRFSGLTLVAVDRPGLAPCASPDGNWMAFIRSVRSSP